MFTYLVILYALAAVTQWMWIEDNPHEFLKDQNSVAERALWSALWPAVTLWCVCLFLIRRY